MVFDTSYPKARANIQRPALQSNFLFHIQDTGLNSIAEAGVESFSFSRSEIPQFIEGHLEEASFEALNVQTARFNHSIRSAPFVEDLEDNSVTLTFIENSDQEVLKFLVSWLRLIRNAEDEGVTYSIEGRSDVRPTNAKNTVNPPAVYQKSAEMILFDPALLDFNVFEGDFDIGNPLSDGPMNVNAKVKFKKMVPENISEGDYTYEGSADKIPLNVDFAFEDYSFEF